MLSKGGPLFLCAPVYSPDGKLLLVACSHGIKAYSVDTGLLVRALSEHSGRATCLQHLDGRLYVSTDAGEVVVFTDDALEVCERVKVDFAVHQVLPTSEGLLLVSTVGERQDARSWLYRWHQGAAVLLQEFPGRLLVDHRNGVLFCGAHQCVSMHSMSSQGLVRLNTLSVAHPVTCLQANDEVLAVGDASGRITVWRLHNQTAHLASQTLHWHSDAVRSLRLVSSGHLLSGGRESVLVLWRMADQSKQFLPRLGESLEQIAVRPDERQFAVCSKSNRIHLVDAASLRCTLTIDGLSWLTGRANLVDRIARLDGAPDTILIRGAAGALQAFDVGRDRSVFVLPVVELLLTDPSSSHTSSPSTPMVYQFACDDQWIVVAEGRPGVEPHFGYIKMFHRRTPSPTDHHQHTVIHQPHRGPVNDICMSTVAGSRVVCSVSEADTFKLFRLEDVYDPALLAEKPAWRVLYADPLHAGPSACALHPSGLLLLAFGKKVVVLDTTPLLDGTNVRPSFVAALPIPVKGRRKTIRRLQWIDARHFIACTDHDIVRMSVDGAECLHWGVKNHGVSVTADRMAVLGSNADQHWLLEFELAGLQVVGRHRLDSAGRAVLCYDHKTVCVLNDGRVLLFGAEEATLEPAPGRPVKRPRVVDHPPGPSDPAVPDRKRAPAVKSRKHLFPLLTTAQLPSMRDIFASFITPRIK